MHLARMRNMTMHEICRGIIGAAVLLLLLVAAPRSRPACEATADHEAGDPRGA